MGGSVGLRFQLEQPKNLMQGMMKRKRRRGNGGKDVA
jgi:hypothetical protein